MLSTLYAYILLCDVYTSKRVRTDLMRVFWIWQKYNILLYYIIIVDSNNNNNI